MFSLYGVCVCGCVVIPFILDVRFVHVPAGVTQQEESHTGFFHLPSAVLALIFLARRIQPFLSLVDREVIYFCVPVLHEYVVRFFPFRGCFDTLGDHGLGFLHLPSNNMRIQ